MQRPLSIRLGTLAFVAILLLGAASVCPHPRLRT